MFVASCRARASFPQAWRCQRDGESTPLGNGTDFSHIFLNAKGLGLLAVARSVARTTPPAASPPAAHGGSAGSPPGAAPSPPAAAGTPLPVPPARPSTAP